MAKASTEIEQLDTDQVAMILHGGKVDLEAMAADPVEVQRGMVDRILNAASADEALTQGSTTAARDIIGVPLEIHGARWLKSSVEGQGLPVYAVIDANRMNDGERLTVTCGALQVVAQLVRFTQLDSFPIVAQFGTTEKPTAQGYYPLWLERVA